VASPKSLEERCALADTRMTKLAVKIPPLIDDLANTTEIAYTAWPDRLHLVGRDGRVAYKGKPGPYGFKPGEMAEVLRRLLPVTSTQATPAN
jgi:type I thyroxine 5'-deiodinase